MGPGGVWYDASSEPSGTPAMNNTKAKALLAAALTLALPATAAAGRLSWFDEAPQRDTLGQVRTPLAAPGETRLSFGIEAYQAFESLRMLDEYRARDGAPGAVPGLSLHGEVATRSGELYPSAGAFGLGRGADAALFHPSDSRLSGFGVKWQHRLDAINTISISAGYRETPWSTELPNVEVLDTRATVSWRGTWSGTWQPGLTGSIFIGDEDVREERYHELGRRYYGFALGGELRVAQHHTPYFSYRLQRNLYAPVDPEFALSQDYEEYSQILAGWKWQLQPNWSLHAEAQYGVNGTQLDPYSPDRSRIFFGTRFDFR